MYDFKKDLILVCVIRIWKVYVNDLVRYREIDMLEVIMYFVWIGYWKLGVIFIMNEF